MERLYPMEYECSQVVLAAPPSPRSQGGQGYASVCSTRAPSRTRFVAQARLDCKILDVPDLSMLQIIEAAQ
jgi:hypothetical protein